MKKIVIALLLILIVTFAGAKGALWYFTKQYVDNKLIEAKAFAQISYKKLDTSLTGNAKLEGLKVYIPLADETINIESVQVIAPDVLSLITLPDQLQQQQFPESLSVLISGVKIYMNSKILNLFDDPDRPRDISDVITTLACGDVYRIGPKELIDIGYDEIIIDFALDYNYNPHKKSLRYRLNNNFRDMARFNLNGEISGASDFNSVTAMSPQLKPGKISLEFIDDSYIDRKKAFCAKKGKQSIDEYTSKHVAQLVDYLAGMGIEPGEGLINAYRNSIENPGTFVIEADLGKLTDFQELTTFEPNDIIQFIHLKMALNGKNIDEISVYIDKDRLFNRDINDPESSDSIAGLPPSQQKIVKKFRPTPVTELYLYKGYMTKVYTSKGKIHRGKMTFGNRGVIEIATRLRSGNISYIIKPYDIKKVEVYR